MACHTAVLMVRCLPYGWLQTSHNVYTPDVNLSMQVLIGLVQRGCLLLWNSRLTLVPAHFTEMLQKYEKLEWEALSSDSSTKNSVKTFDTIVDAVTAIALQTCAAVQQKTQELLLHVAYVTNHLMLALAVAILLVHNVLICRQCPHGWLQRITNSNLSGASDSGFTIRQCAPYKFAYYYYYYNRSLTNILTHFLRVEWMNEWKCNDLKCVRKPT